jgi:hypothetical protein
MDAAILNGLDLIRDLQESARSDDRISKRPWQATQLMQHPCLLCPPELPIFEDVVW